MNTKLILGTLLCFALAACGDKNSDDGAAPETTAQVVTNTSQCYGRTPARTSIYSNRWAMQFRVSNGVLMTSVASFKRDRASVTLWAQYKDQVGKARVSTNFEERGNSLSYEESEVARDTILVNGRPYPFSINFSRQTLKYKFQGPCLVIVRGSEITTLVPYR